MHPPAAKTVAWVQHLLLHYLFTYTYLFSLNIMSSNLLSACNKDDKLRDQQRLFFKTFSRICLLIYPHSSFLLNRQRFSFQFSFRFFDHIKCKDTKPFFYLPQITPHCLTLCQKAFQFILNRCSCETGMFMCIKTFFAQKLL